MVTSYQLRVTAKNALTQDVVALELRPLDTSALPRWSPGAHVTLHLGTFSREYSLCGPNGDKVNIWKIAVKRCPDGRGGSAYVHDDLEVGSTVMVSGPNNHFVLEQASEYVFVAGGIGITPILPMIERVDRLGHDWKLLYLGRETADMPFHDELVSRYGDRVQVHTSHGAGRFDLQKLMARVAPQTSVYCCGPESLMSELETLCEDRNVDVHVERFSPKVVDRDFEPFFVEVAGSDVGLHVPADCSLLDVLLDADLDIMSSCEEGTCGTCEVRVLSGLPDHRDSVLTKVEQARNDRMLPCVSRSRTSKLVIEL